mmetsp:Transcript_374/g.932  ORF Transcript_374/g.932 Transcript_374/m.932 type:complete len:213 (+) Transcript_374:1914-2552(+)
MTYMEVAVGFRGKARHHFASSLFEVSGQLLRCVGHVHDAAVTEVDGRLHLVVLVRLREKRIRVLWWGWRPICGCCGLLLCLRRSFSFRCLGRLLLFHWLHVFLSLGTQHGCYLGFQLGTHSSALCPLQAACDLAQEDGAVQVVPLLPEPGLILLQHGGNSGLDLLWSDHHAHASRLFQCLGVHGCAAHLLQVIKCTIQLVVSLDFVIQHILH